MDNFFTGSTIRFLKKVIFKNYKLWINLHVLIESLEKFEKHNYTNSQETQFKHTRHT